MKILLNNILHNIKIPIMSYGVIAFTKVDNVIKYILINKKNTVGFCDIVKGNYNKDNIELSLKNIIPILTETEIQILITKPFEYIWKYMWNVPLEISSKEVFESNKDKLIELLKNCNSKWKETEWEFPKGRKNYQEREIDCAVREFSEETGIDKKHLDMISNILPIEEMYIGTNLNNYKHNYYLAYLDYSHICLDNYEKQEVKNIKLLSIDECLNHIRDYHKSRKECITIVNNVVKNLNFFSLDINANKSEC